MNLSIKIKNKPNRTLMSIIVYLLILFICVVIVNFIYIRKNEDITKNAYKDDVRTSHTSVISSLSDMANELGIITLQILDDPETLYYLDGRKTNYKSMTYAKTAIADIISRYDISSLIIVDKTDLSPVFTHNSNSNYSDYDISGILSAYKEGFRFHNITNNQFQTPRITYTVSDYRGLYFIYIIDPDRLDEIINLCSPDFDSYIYSGEICLNHNSDIERNMDDLRYVFNTNNYFEDKDNYIVTSFSNNINVISVLENSLITKKAHYELSSLFKTIYTALVIIFCILILGYFILTRAFKNSLASIKQNEQNSMLLKQILTDAAHTNLLLQNDVIWLSDHLSWASHFRYAFLQFDDISNTASLDSSKSTPVKIEALIEDILPQSGIRAYNSFMLNNSVGILFAATQNIPVSFTNEFTGQLEQSIKNNLNIAITTTIGNEFNDITQIPQQITSVVNYSICKFITGYNATILMGSMDYLKKNAEYPQSIELNIINAIHNHNYDKSYESMDKFILTVNELEPILAKEYLIKLAFSLAKNTNTAISFDVINKLSQCRTISDAAKILESLIPLDMTNNSFSNNDFAVIISRYIEQNYSNRDFNLAYLSELTHISAAYLGRKFKQDFNTTFNAYLSEFRIEKSKPLLLNYDKKIDDIATECGFNSTSYFIKIFKTYTFMTPAEYRIKMKNNTSIKK